MFLVDTDVIDNVKGDVCWNDGFGLINIQGCIDVGIEYIIMDQIYDGNIYHKNHCFWDNRKINLVPGCSEDYSFSVMNENLLSGVQYFPKFDKWITSIIRNGNIVLIGLYDTMIEACWNWYEAYRFKVDEYTRVCGIYDESMRAPISRQQPCFSTRYRIQMDGLDFWLPSWYLLDERKNLINIITSTRPDLFEYRLKEAKNDKRPRNVEVMLNILGSYLLELSPLDNEYRMITKKRRLNIAKYEIPNCSVKQDYYPKNTEKYKKIIK